MLHESSFVEAQELNKGMMVLTPSPYTSKSRSYNRVYFRMSHEMKVNLEVYNLKYSLQECPAFIDRTLQVSHNAIF